MSYLGRSAKLSLKAQEKVSFLATAGQTEKTGLSYTPSFIEVYVNGVLLTDTTDFTATNGNSITFTVALLLNDEVTVISLKTFTVADHYTKSDADTLLAAKATNTAVALKAPIASPVFTGNVSHGDNVKAKFGTGNDLEIFHDGSHSRIKDVGTGHLVISGGEVHFNNSANTSNHLVINADGIVTKPLQPAFSARAVSTSGGLAITTWHTLNCTEVFDNNADFDASTNKFTAPVTGRYQLNLTVRLDNFQSNTGYFYVNIETSNRQYYTIMGSSGYSANVQYFGISSSVLTDMDAGDVAYVQYYLAGGNAVANINNETRFTGYLVC